MYSILIISLKIHFIGKNNGSVKGVPYFKCKEKHGVFVRRDKIIHEPSSTLSASTSFQLPRVKPTTGAAVPPSSSPGKRRSSPNLTKVSTTSTRKSTSWK